MRISQRNGKHPFQELVEEKSVGFHNARSLRVALRKFFVFLAENKGIVTRRS